MTDLEEFYRGKKVLITGGTGSLGKALVKRLKDFDCKLFIFSRDEGKQALIYGPDKTIKRIIGDVRDFRKLNTAFERHQPDYVIHTAALKRVDDMELHPDECVKTNILGSQNVATAAHANNVAKTILISTDKACYPVNCYGASKFTAERIFTNFDYNSRGAVFASVRYGNVIASRGSFIPFWLDKLKTSQSIPVTDLACSRFLFTLNDAVDTVLNALRLATGGEVFVPKLSSYSMQVIIKALQLLVKNNFEIDLLGMRPGEKIHEDMLNQQELDQTRIASNNLLAILPEYSRHETSPFQKPYLGHELNSMKHIDNNVGELADLIKRGIREAN